MIETLSVRDLAVVERAEIQFGSGLNAITGETGAGKSVLIGAISLLTGGRADRSMVRAGAAQADVGARIALPAPVADEIAPLLADAGIDECDGGELLLRRTLTASGGGRCFVNNCPATVATLRRIGAFLVDFHGPHDNQSLLSPAFQTDALDSFGRCGALRSEYSAKWNELRQLENRREQLGTDADAVAREIDLLRFQVSEIEEAALDPEEDGDALRAAFDTAANSQRILELADSATKALSEEEGNAVDAIAVAVRALDELADLGAPGAADWLAELRQHSEAISELSRTISADISKLDASPERMRELEERVSLVEKLRHKYGRTIPDILSFSQKAKSRLAELEGRDEELAAISGKIAAAERALRAVGAKLSAQRRKAAGTLAEDVRSELEDLGLSKAGFEVRVDPAKEPLPNGTDNISYGFAPNPGEPMRPLRDIASSGEISRAMLALKTVLAAHDKIPILVFDEIDANVGGEIARVVGKKLAALGDARQVLCITHLPQVASCAASHFVVRKCVEKGRTFTKIDRLSQEARVDELARMLGGANLTSVVREHARELLRPQS